MIQEEILPSKRVKKSKTGLIISIPLVVLIAVLLALIIFLSLFSLVRVDGPSMLPTLTHNQYVLLRNRAAVQNGDIFVFDGTIKNSAGQDVDGRIIKRAIGVGGDKIVFARASNLYVFAYIYIDGRFVLIDEDSYLTSDTRAPQSMGVFENGIVSKLLPIGTVLEYICASEVDSEYIALVPQGHILALGDNRLNSTDSRNAAVMFVCVSTVVGSVTSVLQQGSFNERFLVFIMGGACRRNR
ncbi:MAG: signal peptidase I [Firmicutes bacterium]|nr:signal peptidase I [Bacillota bacterium]